MVLAQNVKVFTLDRGNGSLLAESPQLVQNSLPLLLQHVGIHKGSKTQGTRRDHNPRESIWNSVNPPGGPQPPYLACCMQCRLKVTLPVVSLQKPNRLNRSPCRNRQKQRKSVVFKEAILCILNTQEAFTVANYLEGSRYSHVAVILKLGGTTDKEAPQGRAGPRLERPPRVACDGMFTLIHMIKTGIFPRYSSSICYTHQGCQETADIRSLRCDSVATSPGREP